MLIVQKKKLTLESVKIATEIPERKNKQRKGKKRSKEIREKREREKETIAKYYLSVTVVLPSHEEIQFYDFII